MEVEVEMAPGKDHHNSDGEWKGREGSSSMGW